MGVAQPLTSSVEVMKNNIKRGPVRASICVEFT